MKQIFQPPSVRPNTLIRAWSLLSLAVLLLASSVHAAPTVTEQDTFYDVHGATEMELRVQMRNFGISAKDGKSYDAHASCPVRWHFTYNRSGGLCSMTGVKTTVHCTYKYPRWVERPHVGPRLRQKWDEFISLLRGHEHGHRDISIEAANAIEQAILSMGPRSNCDELSKEANALGHRILEDSKRKQVEYDIRTDHGRLQGVRFP